MSATTQTQDIEPLVRDEGNDYGSYQKAKPSEDEADKRHSVDDIMGEDEQMKVVAAKILSSSGYYAMCLLMIAISTFLIIWLAVGDTESHWWFVMLEVIVTVVIVLEVIVQMVADGKDFWLNGWNVLDFIVCLLCVGSFLIYVFVRDRRQAGDDTAALIVLAIRYLAQGLRVFALMSRASHIRQREEAQQTLKVDFDAVNTAEAEDEAVLEHSMTAQFDDGNGQ